MTKELLAEARRALGIENLVLMIHDASFPSRPDEEVGRGSPYSRGAADLLAWVEERGFTGIQLGPQGITSARNKSPYDGTSFAKNPMSIALAELVERGLLSTKTFDEVRAGVGTSSERVDYAWSWIQHRRAAKEAHARVDRTSPLWRDFVAWRAANASWLARDEKFEAWSRLFGTDDWTRWPSPLPEVDGDEVFAFGQFLVHAQHAAFRTACKMHVFGDLQIGISHRDRFRREHLFLRGYAMGAPPSRTNPDGQPWGYPLLDPDSEEATEFNRARVAKMLSEFDALRVDHPHGHICPWAYDVTAPDPLRAVQNGARLFESPDLPDHPALARYAIARPEQLDRSVPRYADRWVTALDAAQVDRYAHKIDVLGSALLLEVLSTCPYPLASVLARRGLGRFRVTQKADPRNPTDVYSTYQAQAADWVMLGNHDTPPIWRCVRSWHRDKIDAWCDHLQARLGKDAVDRTAVANDAAALAQPMLADLFACDASSVAVFFADLFGIDAIYNQPGVVAPENWTLRVGNDFAGRRGLDVPAALATALRARGNVTLATRIDTAFPRH